MDIPAPATTAITMSVRAANLLVVVRAVAGMAILRGMSVRAVKVMITTMAAAAQAAVNILLKKNQKARLHAGLFFIRA